jgi:hypothetical protein
MVAAVVFSIPPICAPSRAFSSPELCHNQTDPLLNYVTASASGQLALQRCCSRAIWADPATSARRFTRADRRSVDSGAASMLGCLADDPTNTPYALAKAG